MTDRAHSPRGEGGREGRLGQASRFWSLIIARRAPERHCQGPSLRLGIPRSDDPIDQNSRIDGNRLTPPR